MGILRVALKSSIAGGLVYWSVQEGLWSKPEDTINLYCKIYDGVAPYVRQNVPQDVAKALPVVPSVSTMANCARGMWNKGVITSIKYTSELPTHISNGIDRVKSMPVFNESVSNVKGLLDPPPATGKTQ